MPESQPMVGVVPFWWKSGGGWLSFLRWFSPLSFLPVFSCRILKLLVERCGRRLSSAVVKIFGLADGPGEGLSLFEIWLCFAPVEIVSFLSLLCRFVPLNRRF